MRGHCGGTNTPCDAARAWPVLGMLRRAVPLAALAALLFLIFPLALFMLGMIDQFMPLRTASFNHQEEE